MCSRAKEARNNSSSVAPFRHAFETGGERTVRLAEHDPTVSAELETRVLV
jgi:hypothetical protein